MMQSMEMGAHDGRYRDDDDDENYADTFDHSTSSSGGVWNGREVRNYNDSFRRQRWCSLSRVCIVAAVALIGTAILIGGSVKAVQKKTVASSDHAPDDVMDLDEDEDAFVFDASRDVSDFVVIGGDDLRPIFHKNDTDDDSLDDVLDQYGYQVQISYDGRHLAVVPPDGRLHVYAWDDHADPVKTWKPQTGIAMDVDDNFHDGPQHSALTMSADGKRVAYTSNDNVRVYFHHDGAGNNSRWMPIGQPLMADGDSNAEVHYGQHLCLSADGMTLLVSTTSTYDSRVQLYEDREVVVTDNDPRDTWVATGDPIVQPDRYDSGPVVMNGNATRVAMSVLEAMGDNHADWAGRVDVYERVNSTTWQLLGAPIGGTTSREMWGGVLAMSADGNTLAVAPYSGGSRVIVYQYNGEAWQPVGQELHGHSEYERFGYSLALNQNGTLLVVGAPGMPEELREHGGDDKYAARLHGAVHVFQLVQLEAEQDVSMGWRRLGTTVSGYTGDGFGAFVDITYGGRRVVASAPLRRKQRPDGSVVVAGGAVRTLDLTAQLLGRTR